MSTPDGEVRPGSWQPGRFSLPRSDEEPEKEESWVLSYMDIFTLITVFFVVLLVAARAQLQNTQSELQERETELSARLKELDRFEKQTAEDALAVAARNAAIALWSSQINRQIIDADLTETVELKIENDQAELHVQDSVLFGVGNASLQDGGRVLLNRLVPMLKATTGQIFIEGHTDNQPIETTLFHSNWELGAARAAAVLKQLSDQGISPKRLRAVSAGDTAPIASNATEEGRKQNRRVTFILRPPLGVIPSP